MAERVGRILDRASYTKVLDLISEDALTNLYVPNPGNAGDALIDLGFRQLTSDSGTPMQDAQFLTTSRSHQGVSPQTRVLLGGGGWLVPEWKADRRGLIEDLASVAGQIVLLPQSVHGSAELLGALRPHDVVFCRERFTLAYVSRNTRARAELQPDLALYLDPVEVLRSSATPNVASSKRLKHLAALNYHTARACFSRDLRALRCDSERAQPDARRPPLRNDLSSICSWGSTTDRLRQASARALLATVQRYDRLTTDRLHVGIAGAMLGKRVALIASNSTKLKGVYEYSLAHLSNVEYIEGQE